MLDVQVAESAVGTQSIPANVCFGRPGPGCVCDGATRCRGGEVLPTENVKDIS